MYIYTEDDDRWMEAERAARERIQDVNGKIQKARIEVAREIFEEIEKIINNDRLNRKLAERGFRMVKIDEPTFEEQIAELKKKYTEVENGT